MTFWTVRSSCRNHPLLGGAPAVVASRCRHPRRKGSVPESLLGHSLYYHAFFIVRRLSRFLPLAFELLLEAFGHSDLTVALKLLAPQPVLPELDGRLVHR